ncbi:MAG: XisI protein [Symploca sp. SIO1B1]|nr:XisI protein [Symploca sp. SIO1B1]
MDKLEQYRSYIKQLLTEYASYKSLNKTIERQFVCDTENDHYQIVNMGWDEREERRIYGCTIHIDIKDGKIWIQHNMTEIQLGEELVRQGVPKEDIVLGFHSPFMRQFTDYAVS